MGIFGSILSDIMKGPDTVRREELQDIHNQGQKDRSNGEYNRPHGDIEMLIDFTTSTEKQIEDNAKYDQGWNGQDD